MLYRYDFPITLHKYAWIQIDGVCCAPVHFTVKCEGKLITKDGE